MKKPLSERKKAQILKLYKEGLSVSGIASEAKVSKYSVYRVIDGVYPRQKAHYTLKEHPKFLKERFEREHH